MGELTIKAYGAVDAKNYIPGAEALPSDGEEAASADENDQTVEDNESEDGWVDVSHSEGEDGWVDVSHSEGEDGGESDSDEDDDQEDEDGSEWEDAEEEEEGDEAESGVSDDDDGSDASDDSGEEEYSDSEEQESDEGTTIISSIKIPRTKRDKKKQKRIRKDLKRMQKRTEASPEDPNLIEERKSKAAAVSLSRILTDKDFSRIDAAQVKKQMEAAKARKRKVADDLDDSIKR